MESSNFQGMISCSLTLGTRHMHILSSLPRVSLFLRYIADFVVIDLTDPCGGPKKIHWIIFCTLAENVRFSSLFCGLGLGVQVCQTRHVFERSCKHETCVFEKKLCQKAESSQISRRFTMGSISRRIFGVIFL